MAVLIKKYPNRRLYDTRRSAYVNLEQVAELVRGGEEVQVVDARDGRDHTKSVLLQILLEVLDGADLLPIGMLRRLIRATGTSPAERLLRTQLATGLELVSSQLDRMEALIAPPPPPPPPAPEPRADAGGRGATVDPELDELRERLADLERRLTRS